MTLRAPTVWVGRGETGPHDDTTVFTMYSGRFLHKQKFKLVFENEIYTILNKISPSSGKRILA